MQRKPQTARQTERKQHGQQGEFFLEVENCTNIRRLHSNMYIFFQSKLVASADKSSDVTCHICLPLSFMLDRAHVQMLMPCVRSPLA